MPAPVPHQVLLHRPGRGPATTVASFLSVALLRGEAALLLARPGTLTRSRAALEEAGVDVALARAQGRYVELDADAGLARFRDGAGIHADRFHAFVEPLLAGLAKRHGAVAAYGEMVDVLVEQGDLVGALLLEQLWQPLTRRLPVRLLCGYAHGPSLTGSGGVDRVHELHDAGLGPVDATWALDLPPDLTAAPVARGAVADLCRGLGVAGQEWADDAELVVAELVGNVVRHTRSRPTLSVDVRGPEVTLSVTDASTALPVPREDLLGEDGRGCLIVAALSHAWGVDLLSGGKRVWARLRPLALHR